VLAAGKDGDRGAPSERLGLCLEGRSRHGSFTPDQSSALRTEPAAMTCNPSPALLGVRICLDCCDGLAVFRRSFYRGFV